MKKIKLITIAHAALTCIVAFALTSCSSSSKSSVTGAGATFPLPFYNIAFKAYQDSTNTLVTYGGIGSGGGIRSLKDKIVDFAGTDAFLSEKELKAMPGEVLHIPTCLGAIVLAYNLPSVNNINLNGEIIADIFLGNITKWNDTRIAELNTGISLPDLKITPTYRSDGSGTTFVFSDFMSKVSPAWAEQLGTAKALKWPVGIAAKGNPGVAGTIKQTEGAIGYIGSEYGFSLKIPMAKIQNSSGNFVSPTSESISAAASIEMPEDMRVMITNSASPEAYPISCFTWLLIYKDQSTSDKTSLEQAKETVKLMKWMLGKDAQNITKIVHYSPLPQSVVTNSLKALEGVTFGGNKL